MACGRAEIVTFPRRLGYLEAADKRRESCLIQFRPSVPASSLTSRMGGSP
jgi:hypothetical protein